MANTPQRQNQPRRRQPQAAPTSPSAEPTHDPSVADLRALLAEQHARIDALTQQHETLTQQHDALIQQHDQMAEVLQQLTRPHEAPIAINDAASEAAPECTPEVDAGEPAGARTATSRRGLLKWGGLGAAAALAAAGAAGLSKTTAHANTGDTFISGQANYAQNVTLLEYNGTEVNPTALYVIMPSNDSTGIVATVGNSASTTTAALYGAAGNGTYAVGVYGTVGQYGNGVYGTAGQYGTGVYGIGGTSGNGVYGSAAGAAGYGVIGYASSGYGVVAGSDTGIAISASGTGRILQEISGFTGAPTAGSYYIGEQIRDNVGDLYICVVSGTPGTWHKVAAGVPGVSGATNFLANPIRLLDTRASGSYAAGSVHTLQVTGVLFGGISVPSGAVGVVGNVTVVGPTGGGDLRLYPGATAPNTSSINFAKGQVIANGVVVGLNGSGQLNIKVDMPTGTHTNVLFDASGYIL